MPVSITDLLEGDYLINSAVILAPPDKPLTCFPEAIATFLAELFPKQWDKLSTKAKNYLQWMSVKAESIDRLAPFDNEHATRGFELLAIDRKGHSFGIIQKQAKEMEIPLVLLRFSSIIAALATIRLLKGHAHALKKYFASTTFTQNIDAIYLNYPKALKQLLDWFPEARRGLYIEISENLTPDYVPTAITLAQDLGLGIALDDSNQMEDSVRVLLAGLAKWIKIDFKGTSQLEQDLANGKEDVILRKFQFCSKTYASAVLVLEGLSDHSELKAFLRESWKDSHLMIYYQSRERLPKPPWNQYFGLLQEHFDSEYGLFFKGLLQSE